jgi:hypothetical protein
VTEMNSETQLISSSPPTTSDTVPPVCGSAFTLYRNVVWLYLHLVCCYSETLLELNHFNTNFGRTRKKMSPQWGGRFCRSVRKFLVRTYIKNLD